MRKGCGLGSWAEREWASVPVPENNAECRQTRGRIEGAMAFEIELRDEAGRTVARFWTGIERSYVLPDGRRCAVPQAGAWCHNCRAFVAAQEVPSLERVDQRLVALRAGPE